MVISDWYLVFVLFVIAMDWSLVNSWWRNHATLRILYLLFLAQLVSFLLALCSFLSSLIAKLGNRWLTHFINFSIFYLIFTIPSFKKRKKKLKSNAVTLDSEGVDGPLSQSLFVYITLALVYGSIMLYRRQQLQVYIFIYFQEFPFFIEWKPIEISTN